MNNFSELINKTINEMTDTSLEYCTHERKGSVKITFKTVRLYYFSRFDMLLEATIIITKWDGNVLTNPPSLDVCIFSGLNFFKFF